MNANEVGNAYATPPNPATIQRAIADAECFALTGTILPPPLINPHSKPKAALLRAVAEVGKQFKKANP